MRRDEESQIFHVKDANDVLKDGGEMSVNN